MTPQQAQIQDLLNTIDEVLNKTSPRLPWVMTGDADQQRRVLEQTRRYLSTLQQPESPTSALAGASPSQDGGHGDNVQGYAQYAKSPVESAQQVLQAVLQEMSYLRTSVMQPMRSDLELLYRQRESLVQEIKGLEAQRQQYALSPESANQQQMMSDFLQSLMGRLQENLTGQVAQMLTNLEAQSIRDRALMGSSGGSMPALAATENSPAYQPVLTPTERLEQIQRIQSQSDQLLLRLDNTLRVIFESLQNNLQTYEDSLGLGLDKMHTLGQQGEAMFTALVNRLAQQLGREASNYLQSSIQDPNWSAPGKPVGEGVPGQSTSPLPNLNIPPVAATAPIVAPVDDDAELRTQIQTNEVLDDQLEDQIDLLLSELRGDTTPSQLSSALNSLNRLERSPSASSTSREDLEDDLGELDDLDGDLVDLLNDDRDTSLNDLDRLNLEVDDLDLDASTGGLAAELDDDLTLFQDNTFDSSDDDLTVFQVNEVLTQFQLDDEGDDRSDRVTSPPLIDNLDSALDLLNQISTESDINPLADAALPGASSPNLTVESTAETAFLTDSAAVDSPDSPYEELDEFYESLFGAAAIPVDENWAEAPIDRHVASSSLDSEPAFEPEFEPNLAGTAPDSPVDSSLNAVDTSLELLDQAAIASRNDPALDSGSLADMDVQLFDGLSDPASQQPDEADSLASDLFGGFSSQSLDLTEDQEERSPQAVENLLFGEPLLSEAPSVPSWDDDETALLNLPSASTTHEAALDASETIETIGSLADLMDLTLASDLPSDLLSETDNSFSNRYAEDHPDSVSPDSYEAAAADEDLLAAAESYDESRLDFQVGAETLQQLSADLFALERSEEPSPASLPPVDIAPPTPSYPFSDSEPTLPLNEPDFTTQQAFGESLQEAMNQDLTLPLPPDQIAPTEADNDDEIDAVYRFLEELQAPVEPPVNPPPADLTDEDPTLPLLYPTPVYSLPLDDYAPTRSLAELMDSELADLELTDSNPTDSDLSDLADLVLMDLATDPLADSTLPPGREDLSLSDYQMLMLMSSSVSDSVSPLTASERLLPEPSPSTPTSPSLTFPVSASREEPGELDDLFADELFGDVLSQGAVQPAPELSTEPDPGTQSDRGAALDPDTKNSVFLADLFTDVPNDLAATEAPLKTDEGNDAFTLDGLGSLFEDLPSIEPATPISPPSGSSFGASSEIGSSTDADTMAEAGFTLDDWLKAEPEQEAPTAADWGVTDAPTRSDLDADVNLDAEDKKKTLKPATGESRGFGAHLKQRQQFRP